MQLQGAPRWLAALPVCWLVLAGLLSAVTGCSSLTGLVVAGAGLAAAAAAGLVNRRASQVRISQVWCYPVKSCRGYRVRGPAEADRAGLRWDRRFGLLDPAGVLMTQKKAPELATLRPELDLASGQLVMHADKSPTCQRLVLPLEPSPEEVTPVQAAWLGSQAPIAVLQYKSSGAWLAEALPDKYNGCTICQMDPAAQRTLRNGRLAEIARSDDLCRLHDGAPLSIVSEASLKALNRRLKHPVTAERFRTNIVVSGCAAFEEASWTELSLLDQHGTSTRLRPLMDAYRCTMVTIDQHTGTRPHGHEVSTALKKFRVVSPETHGPVGSGPQKPLFAVFVTLDAPAAKFSEGDTLQVSDWLGEAPSLYVHNRDRATEKFSQVPAGQWGSGEFWKPVASAQSEPDLREVTQEELAKHSSRDDMWVVVNGLVYDVTGYDHPGGFELLEGHDKQDVTVPFKKQGHSPTAMDEVAGKLVGQTAGRKTKAAPVAAASLPAVVQTQLAPVLDPSDLTAFMSTTDFGNTAKAMLKSSAHAYYEAGAEDDETTAENERIWSDYLLRPRMFVDVTNVDMSVTLLGQHTLDIPMIAAPTALLMMAHERGEAGVAAACSAVGAANCLSTTASMDIETVAKAAPDCYRWFQLYVYRDKEKTARLVQRAEAYGYSAIVLTVDLPVLGNRTSLKRIGFKVPKEFKMANMSSESKTQADLKAEKEGVNVKDPGDRQAYIKKLYDQNMSLDLIEWLASVSSLPVVIKGILRGEDAARAAAFDNVQGTATAGQRPSLECQVSLSPITVGGSSMARSLRSLLCPRSWTGWTRQPPYAGPGSAGCGR